MYFILFIFISPHPNFNVLLIHVAQATCGVSLFLYFYISLDPPNWCISFNNLSHAPDVVFHWYNYLLIAMLNCIKKQFLPWGRLSIVLAPRMQLKEFVKCLITESWKHWDLRKRLRKACFWIFKKNVKGAKSIQSINIMWKKLRYSARMN